MSADPASASAAATPSSERPPSRGRRLLAAAGWLLAVIVIALGAAGIVTAMDPPPTGDARPELTQRGDAVVTPTLDAIEAEVSLIADDMAALGGQARNALVAVNGADPEGTDAAISAGDLLVERIRSRALSVDQALDAVPLVTTPEGAYEVSSAVRQRYDVLRTATASTAGLDAAWIRLTTGSSAASRLAARLRDHDDAVVAAAEQGRDADYDAAIATLDEADAAIVAARAQRDRLAATVDVTVLDQWLDRNAGYDQALRALYQALRDVGGRVTDDVRTAIEAERAAKDRLPPDARGLIVIMSDIGRGGMNTAIITIEEARGALAEALAAAASATPAEAAPSGTDAGS
jgi:hypothetical protein